MAENEAGERGTASGGDTTPESGKTPMPVSKLNRFDYVQKCGAPCRTKGGEPCEQPAMPNGRCKMHGGRAHPGGPGHPALKHGRYSKFLPARLRERYEEASRDPELLSTREDVALVEGRIKELAQKLYTGETGKLWVDLRKAWKAYAAHKRNAAAARNASDEDRARECEGMAADTLDALGKMINAGATEAQTWDELKRTLHDKAKLAKIEWNRLVDLNQLVTVEQAQIYAMALLNSVVKHVHDPRTRAAINADFKEALNMHGSSGLLAPARPVVVEAVEHDQDHPTEDAEIVVESECGPAGREGGEGEDGP
jgi:hypothetical protein